MPFYFLESLDTVTISRISPERLFLDIALKSSDSTQTELLGIMLGLDINTLYELAAEHRLAHGNFANAVKLYQLSKVWMEWVIYITKPTSDFELKILHCCPRTRTAFVSQWNCLYSFYSVLTLKESQVLPNMDESKK